MKLVELRSGKWVIRVGVWPFWSYLQTNDGWKWNSIENAARFASFDSEDAARKAALAFRRNSIVRVVKV